MPEIMLASPDFDSMWILALLLLWVVFPFALFRVNPYELFKAAIETRRMNSNLAAKQGEVARSAGDG